MGTADDEEKEGDVGKNGDDVVAVVPAIGAREGVAPLSSHFMLRDEEIALAETAVQGNERRDADDSDARVGADVGDVNDAAGDAADGDDNEDEGDANKTAAEPTDGYAVEIGRDAEGGNDDVDEGDVDAEAEPKPGPFSFASSLEN